MIIYYKQYRTIWRKMVARKVALPQAAFIWYNLYEMVDMGGETGYGRRKLSGLPVWLASIA